MSRAASLVRDVLQLLSKYGAVYLGGVRNTLLLSVAATFAGCVIGFVCGILQTIPVKRNDSAARKALLGLVRAVIRVYVEVFRGTPMILQAVFIYYGLPYFTMNRIQFRNVWTVSLFVVSVNTGAYMTESFRGGILSVDRGQTEACHAIGLTHLQTMAYVVMPQALRNIMPQIGNNYIINVKDTSVMFIIGFSDFFAVHKAVSGAVFKYFPSAVIEMAGYLILTLAASALLRLAERRMDGSSDYALAERDSLTMAAGTYRHPDAGEERR